MSTFVAGGMRRRARDIVLAVAVAIFTVAVFALSARDGLLAIVVVLGLIPAIIARRKGRSFVGWWLFGAVLLIAALPASLLVGPAPPHPRADDAAGLPTRSPPDQRRPGSPN